MPQPWRNTPCVIITLMLTTILGMGQGQASERFHYPARVEPSSPLEIDAALDHNMAEPLLKAFTEKHPNIDLTYTNYNTFEVFNRAQQSHSSKTAADVLISSAMPWQMQLANAGYAQPIDTPNARQWPQWAQWRRELFAFTFEPVVMVYRQDLSQQMPPPRSHDQLLTALNSPQTQLKGQVITYDPHVSAFGLMLGMHDARFSPQFWALANALSQARFQEGGTTNEMIQKIIEGQARLGYNLLGSYAIQAAKQHPELIVQVPEDYALVVTRLALQPRNAPHPKAGRLFIDFLLSDQGQSLMATQTPLFALKHSIQGPWTAQSLKSKAGTALHPIPIDTGLLTILDPLKRRTFLRRWDQTRTDSK
ncbi:ABC transporter substrate-binding protein [Terasakiispira papahanaumokuakeensis]|nr:ABC transporter substrate-binding protein [Terasakiispira papahanaumokuakeensis]